MNGLLKTLVAEFADAEYAHAYMESHRITRLAAQIHSLRKQRGLSQAELAQRVGITQERVCKIEDADFESLTMRTLHKFACAFDVDLRISFSEFSSGILDVAKLDSEKLRVDDREQDLENFKKSINSALPKLYTSRDSFVTTKNTEAVSQKFSSAKMQTVAVFNIAT
ncbi:XRE family transcriptional regulator [Massilia violaceinigra]|uniref:XRE family transcriptional regulator n=1 Tax=Massilia violaceinigra TaxID=2045208 RepID=A0ABY4A5H4_9BURK|nr:helix-turn-helix transcriptional regulator [Massilia violaceinigra]UOD28811.1 XRE family transcriptional regulator [Massilia violaceinigra]